MNIKKTLFERAENFLDDVKFGMPDASYQAVLGLIKQFGWEEEFKEYLNASGGTEVRDILSINLANGDILLVEAKGSNETGVWISVVTADNNKVDIANISNIPEDPDTFSVTVAAENSKGFFFSQKAEYKNCYAE